MKSFSIFEQALKFSGVEETENLGEIASLSRRDFLERESFICHTTTASVEYACLMIENAVLLRTNRAGRVYAGMEKLSALQPIIDRYMRIADVSESVYLFGEDDWRPPRHPNIRLIGLNGDFRLAREWFVIAHSSSLSCAVVAFDESGVGTTPEQIRYWAFKTSNPNVVHSLAKSVEGVIDWTLAA
ncbi:MAG TPA: DICT sensory domain-containing protein [Pyrinomonadaceae bacterium]|nr:DICT sensory domain-containing protein [Pyrinomonadaceae bacterium]